MLKHSKNPKNWDTRKICSNHPKIGTRLLYHRKMHPNDADRVANIVDPDWLEQSDLGLHCLPRYVCQKTWEHYGNRVIEIQIFIPNVLTHFRQETRSPMFSFFSRETCLQVAYMVARATLVNHRHLVDFVDYDFKTRLPQAQMFMCINDGIS